MSPVPTEANVTTELPQGMGPKQPQRSSREDLVWGKSLGQGLTEQCLLLLVRLRTKADPKGLRASRRLQSPSETQPRDRAGWTKEAGY